MTEEAGGFHCGSSGEVRRSGSSACMNSAGLVSLLFTVRGCNSLPANCAVHSSVPCLCEPTPPLRYDQRAVDAQQQYSYTTCSLTRGRSLACRSTELRSANWDLSVATRHTRQSGFGAKGDGRKASRRIGKDH